MSRRAYVIAGTVALGVIVGIGAETGAQAGLDTRIAAVTDGTLRFTVAAADRVCGNGANWSRSRDGRTGTFKGMWNGPVGARDVETTCDRGPVRMVLKRERGDT
jgi:hypothetical protein